MTAAVIADRRAERVVHEARRWIGTPYLHQASLCGVGCDCLGLVRGIWRALYGTEPETVPHYSADWAEASGIEHLLLAGHRHFEPVDVRDMAAGDVVLFRWRPYWPAKHMGVVSGGDTMIHAHAGAGVAEVHFGIWARRIAQVFRFPPPVERG